MNRLALAALLFVGGALTAHADADTYNDITRRHRSDDVLHADVAYCARRYGAPKNGVPTSRVFKRCMLTRGWKFVSTKREHYYPDPDNPGLMCHDFAIFGVTGSSCSNF